MAKYVNSELAYLSSTVFWHLILAVNQKFQTVNKVSARSFLTWG
jgi:hypothetical protein